MQIQKNIKNKIVEILIDSGLFDGFTIQASPFYTESLQQGETGHKGIYVYCLDCDSEAYGRSSQNYVLTGDLVIELVLISGEEVTASLDSLHDNSESIIGTVELKKFTQSGTGFDKVLDGVCSSIGLQRVTISQDAVSEYFICKASMKYQFKAIHKFTAETPHIPVNQINLEIYGSTDVDKPVRIIAE